MPEKRRTRTTGGQVKSQRPTTQTTLKDLFQKTNSSTTLSEKEPESGPEHAEAVPSSPAAGLEPRAQPPRRPEPSQLFPIFTKVSTVRDKPRDGVIILDDTEVIDVTVGTPGVETSTEPPLSTTHQSYPHPDFSRVTSLSPPASPRRNVHYGSDTDVLHAGTHSYVPPHKPSGKSNRRPSGLGEAPLPSSFSQHVRGEQHSYTSSQAPLGYRVRSGCSTSKEGINDFLTKWRQVDGTSPTLPDRIHRSLTPQQCEKLLGSFSREFVESHPVFAQLSTRQENPSHHIEMWTRRFRPRRANEVLGNEGNALYLRDWLRALELHMEGPKQEGPTPVGGEGNKEKNILKKFQPRGAKRPRVVRAVTRKRHNKRRRVDSDDDLDDFVVYSDTEEDPDELPEDSEDELSFCQRTLTRLHRRDIHDGDDPNVEVGHTTSQPQEVVPTGFADSLTNTLLVTGPPGCGKTAAVYACAEELGWEVFEVYPGIGRRNGASLDHLVGDVGRNHIVQRVHRHTPTKRTRRETTERMGLRGYLDKKKAGEFAGFGESQEAGTEAEPISVEGDSPRNELEPLPPDPEGDSSEEAANWGKCHAESDGSNAIVRQSLILLEEVDILFKEDGGFWPAVVELIRRCQRPVVMTCNDPGLVPLGDLPLQRVLVFEPCPSPVAATFLQCVSLTEGCLVPHEDLMVLYERTDAIDGLDVPDAVARPGSEPVRLPDLRRSITKLQMLCAGARHGSASEMHQGDEAEGHARRSARPISAACRVAPIGSTVESEWWRQMNRHSELMSRVDAELWREATEGGEVGDEEVGHRVLREREGEVSWTRDELIAEEAIRHARGVHADGTGPSKASINPAARLDAGGLDARVAHQSRMAGALGEIVGAGCAVMGQAAFLDYGAWVGHMVRVDDEQEARALAGRAGRGTRNSLRRVHARTVAVGEGARAVLRGRLDSM